jgi:hypothetical protein
LLVLQLMNASITYISLWLINMEIISVKSYFRVHLHLKD